MVRKRHFQRRAFSLAESVLALALFAAVSYGIGVVCFNCLYPLDMKPSDSELEFFKDFSTQKILAVKDYDALNDGINVETLSGESSSLTAEADYTKILDLFEIRIKADGESGFDEIVYAVRPSWYQNSSDRSDLLEDLKDEIKDRRDLVKNAQTDEEGKSVVYSPPISKLASSDAPEPLTAFPRISESEKRDSEENTEEEDGGKKLFGGAIEALKNKARNSLDSSILREKLGVDSGTSGSSRGNGGSK